MRKFAQLYKFIRIEIKIIYKYNYWKYNMLAKVLIHILLPSFEMMTIIIISFNYEISQMYMFKIF